MANELITYYEKYKKTLGADAYSMGKSKDTSRVRFLYQWIKAFVKPGSTILDVGCGDMYLSSILPEYQWTGVDVAPDMSNGKARKQDLMSTPYPFPAASFDAAVCSEVLEHLWDPLIVQKEVARLLKPDGCYFMSTPNYDFIDHFLSNFRQLVFNPDKPWLYEHIRQYDFTIHKQMLEASGMEVKEVVGADAHYSVFFRDARIALKDTLTNDFSIKIDDAGVDMIIGLMFPKFNHTIMIIAKPKETK